MITGAQVRQHFHELAFSPEAQTTSLPDGLKGAINGILTRAAGSDADRKLVLKYLTGSTSSKDLTPGQWFALSRLVQPYRDEALGWMSDNPKFRRALDAVLADMVRQDGQVEMRLEE